MSFRLRLVLMGGTARSVVPGSFVGVHLPQPVMVVGSRAYFLIAPQPDTSCSDQRPYFVCTLDRWA